MPRAYILSPEAQQDITEIRAFYLQEANARVARYVLAEITRAFGFLARTPGAGHSRSDLTNEPIKFWPVFSFFIVYDPASSRLALLECCTVAETWLPCFSVSRLMPSHPLD